MWDTILSGRSYIGILTNRKKNGELFNVYHTITPLNDDKGNITHFVATSKDITQQKLMEERINYLAYYDTLTELPNRTLFIDRLNQSIARVDYEKRLVGVLVINLDRFKLINDTFGPNVGDDVLKEIAKRLSISVREGDTIARLGSDEFGITLAAVAHSEDIILIVEKLMKTISQTIKAGEEEMVITPSIGISIYPNDGKDVQTLIQNADIALSNAKEQGGNNYQFYTEGMNKKASELILMERQLSNALNNDEFILHYQPYWDINTKKITGMEALIRLKSKDGGLIPPGKFIPVLEETKMIIEVGEWILRTAVRQVKEWQNNRHPVVPVSVNLSLIQFRQKDLAEMVKKIIEEFGLNTSLLTLEITESAFMQDIEFTKSVLETLKGIGCSISIDDFGTGYSSLAYLKRFPIDNLKIDISFIREIATDPDTASIVTAIIGMAHTLNMKTIAEGVETEDQWTILRLLRCDMIQGFYLSKPLPAEDIEKLLIH
jgi:diguanylate cyclase (GGDEF)-like protein